MSCSGKEIAEQNTFRAAALVLYSLMFLLMASGGAVVACKLHDNWLPRLILISLACLFAGVSIRLMRNAFRR